MDIRKNLKGLIFDLDGTLMELKVNWLKLRNKIETNTDQKFDTFNTLFEDKVLFSNKKISDMIEKAEIKGVRDGIILPEVKSTLKLLKNYYKIAIVTRNGRKSALAALKKLHISESILVAREDVNNLKPHPEAIQLAIKKLKLANKNVIIIGDTIHDVEAARRLNIPCIVIFNNNLEYVPKGDYNIRNIIELRGLFKK